MERIVLNFLFAEWAIEQMQADKWHLESDKNWDMGVTHAIDQISLPHLKCFINST